MESRSDAPPTEPISTERVALLRRRNKSFIDSGFETVSVNRESIESIDAALAELQRLRSSAGAPGDRDGERFRFCKKHGFPQATRAPDGSRLWYMDRASDNVEMVRANYDECIDAAMGTNSTEHGDQGQQGAGVTSRADPKGGPNPAGRDTPAGSFSPEPSEVHSMPITLRRLHLLHPDEQRKYASLAADMIEGFSGEPDGAQ